MAAWAIPVSLGNEIPAAGPERSPLLSRMPDQYQYTGLDNLEVILDAVNYNRFQVDEIVKAAGNEKNVVDFGAGIGTFAKMVAARGLHVVCVDQDARLRERLQRDGFEVHSTVDEFPDNSVAFIYSLNVLEHIEDDGAVLRALYAKLTPGGRLFLYVPAFMCLWSSLDVKVEHFRRYYRRSLAQAVEQAGFHVRKAIYADSAGFLTTLIFKLVGNKQGNVNRTALWIFDRILFPSGRLLDRLGFQYVCGKNVILLAEKPGA
jgi:SAM-dependent methyltransferase